MAGGDGAAPLRILYVTTDVCLGGAERQVELLAREMTRRGHQVRWATLQDPGSFADELDLAGLDVVGLGMRRGVADPRGVLRLADRARSFRPDVLHSHMVHANLLARAARLLAWVPVQISTAHSLREGGRRRELAYRLTDPCCTLTTHVSEAGARRYVQVGAVPAGKICTVPNGFAWTDARTAASRGAASDVAGEHDEASRRRLRAELGVGDGFLWLAVGRLEPPKDYPTMLEAFCRASVAASEPAPEPGHVLEPAPESGRAPEPVGEPASLPSLAVAGYGSERPALEAALHRLGPAGLRVHLLGARSDVQALLGAADGYVLSSRLEGLPLALLEAGAAALPIVATDAGGVAEIVRNGETGLLVPPADPAALAEAMRAVMAMSAEDRRSLGRAAQRSVRQGFAIERVAELWLHLYRELLAGRVRASRDRRRTRVPAR